MAKNGPPPERDDAWLTRERILLLVLAAATISVCVLGFVVAQPFVPAITWAIVFAVIVRPVHEAIARRFRRVEGAGQHVIRGDCSRPETVAEMRRRGLNVVSADKWPGSVEDGIEHLRGYEQIVIHPSCKGLIEEARHWRYARDPRTDDVLPRLVPGNDHGWDAVRYALAPIIRPRRSIGVLA